MINYKTLVILMFLVFNMGTALASDSDSILVIFSSSGGSGAVYGDYIANQDTSDQPASFRISGDGLLGGYVSIGSTSPIDSVYRLSLFHDDASWGGALAVFGKSNSDIRAYFGLNTDSKYAKIYGAEVGAGYLDLIINEHGGNVGIGTTETGDSKLKAEGIIESSSGGFKFPDETIQTTASENIPSGYYILGDTESAPSGYTSTGKYIIDNADRDGRWMVKTDLPLERACLTSSAVDSKIYVIGGVAGTTRSNSNQCYDPSTDSWEIKADMPTGRSHLASAVVDGKIYVIGGYGGTKKENECYDPATDSWTIKADMPTARYGHTISVVDGKIYVMGGYGSGYLDVHECYDPSTDSWTTKASLKQSMRYMTSSVMDGKIYLFGGYTGAEPFATNDCYDPSTNTWTSKSPLPTPRFLLFSASMDNYIYVIGGNAGDTYTTTNEAYNPFTDSWTSKGNMLNPRGATFVSIVDNKIYVFGGYGGMANNEVYDPYDGDRFYIFQKD